MISPLLAANLTAGADNSGQSDPALTPSQTSWLVSGGGGGVALAAAAENGHTAVVEMLLQRGWQPNGSPTAVSAGYAPLYIAAMNGHYEVRVTTTMGSLALQYLAW